MMKVAFMAVALLAMSVNAVDETGGVEALVDSPDGGAGTHPDGLNGQATGPGYETAMANFPGPKYGLPGYKESHKWETDFDRTSPLIFDHRMYKALIAVTPATAALKSEAQLTAHWNAAIAANSYPNCPQGNIWFNANSYYQMHKGRPEFNMGGSKCELFLEVYVTQGVFAGYETSRHEGGNADFPGIGTKLFNPIGEDSTTAVFQAKAGLHFATPDVNAGRDDNTFSPARHMTLVFWMQVAPPSEAPNAELFAYGGAQSDNYFRTGFGCIAAGIDAADNNCYFITVFQAGNVKEYFHTYNAENFPVLREALGGARWAHVTYMLTTAHPGFKGDGAPGCPNNAASATQANAPATACNGALFLWLNKKKINLVDWNDGTSTTYAPAWKGPVTGTNLNSQPVWNNPKPQGNNGIHRRFWVAPLATLEGSTINNNKLLFDLPWTTSYKGGVFMCDMTAIPSGSGGFGVDARRKIAMEAMFEIMEETRAAGCVGKGISTAGPPGSKVANLNNKVRL
jgi:hypothetical protein